MNEQEPKIEVNKAELIERLETYLAEMEGLLEGRIHSNSVEALKVVIREMKENLEELKSL